MRLAGVWRRRWGEALPRLPPAKLRLALEALHHGRSRLGPAPFLELLLQVADAAAAEDALEETATSMRWPRWCGGGGVARSSAALASWRPSPLAAWLREIPTVLPTGASGTGLAGWVRPRAAMQLVLASSLGPADLPPQALRGTETSQGSIIHTHTMEGE